MDTLPGTIVPQSPFGGKAIYYRLVALWVVCEAMLGGIIHGLRLPISGLVVGSCAVICICLIARYVPQKGSIIKATIVVAIFKMMLSPQAPPPAYIAVFFQGVLGELLFWNRKYYTASCFALAILALLESGLQRIIVLTIVSGNDLWVAINSFLNGLTGQKGNTNYSLWIGGIYVAMHLVLGLVIGWWASLLPKRIAHWKNRSDLLVEIEGTVPAVQTGVKKKRKRIKVGLFIAWLLLIVLYVQSYYNIGQPLLPSHISLKILLRSLIIVLTWVFIVGPLLTRVLHNWLQKKQSLAQQDVQEVLRLLPHTQALIHESWKRSRKYKGLSRIDALSKIILVNSLTVPLLGKEKSDNKKTDTMIYILTGPIGSGKTGSIINWASSQSDVYGIITPVVDGKRMFRDIHSGDTFRMEAIEDEETVIVGRYSFSKKSFEKANEIIRESVSKDGWLVIDEIGPLELRGEGFYDVLKEVMELRQNRLLLVVREGITERVREFLGIRGVIVVKSISYLSQITSEKVASNPL